MDQIHSSVALDQNLTPEIAFSLVLWVVAILATLLFAYIMFRRIGSLKRFGQDPRLHPVKRRVKDLLVYGILQKRQPRYLWAGICHVVIFWGFVVLGLRSLELIFKGLGIPVLEPLLKSGFGSFYSSIKDIFELLVFTACMAGIIRRAFLKPSRYKGSNQLEAYIVLALISFLMVTDVIFEAAEISLTSVKADFAFAVSVAGAFLQPLGKESIYLIYQASYWTHILTFFTFLNLLPLSKHFHIITSLPNVFFKKQEKGTIKPISWSTSNLDEISKVGIQRLTDFTWKHILDLYTCTECGRCQDNCPAFISGRNLSPKMFTIRLRNQVYKTFPIFGRTKQEDTDLFKNVITEEEVWSCTTCGACEEECPVFIEYIDKIVDLRRHLVESGQNPNTFNQVFMHLEKTGNPFGKPPAKRANWASEAGLEVPIIGPGQSTQVLYFVDSYGSYDPRCQSIAISIVKALKKANIPFGILGPRERDSGHQVRRMGEEGLFQLLLEENMDTFSSVKFHSMITTDPHAFNTIKNDYKADFPVYHYSGFFFQLVRDNRLRPELPVPERLYTYHDPCYLGRHNNIYDEPRRLIKSLPGIRFLEMERSKDRSFCCGGADVTLWHEVKEEERMAVKRVKMALESGANCIITACPFCLLHFEDAIKTLGLEDRIEVIDLMELFVSTLK